MKVDWDELSAEFQQSNDRSFTEVERADAQRRFVRLMLKNFDAILAERSAAQRLRDAALDLYTTLQANDDEGLINEAKEMRALYVAMKDFDKETQNET